VLLGGVTGHEAALEILLGLVELDEDFGETVDDIRDDPLFKDISRRLDEYITPYNPETWQSPKDAQAREFYSWDADDAG
jgi:cyclase